MPIYMYQAAYSTESWAAQLKDPQNRVETTGRKLCEAAGGKLLGGWYCFGGCAIPWQTTLMIPSGNSVLGREALTLLPVVRT